MHTTLKHHRKTPKRIAFIQTLCALGGLFGLIFAARAYQPLDHEYFYIAGLVFFFTPFGILAYVTRRAKRAHTRPSEVSTYLFLGCPLVFAILLANGALDFSQPEQKTVLVSRKYVVHGKSTSYVVEFPSWRNNGIEKMDVSAATYSSLHSGEPIALEVHRGLLGFTWVRVHAQPNSSGW